MSIEDIKNLPINEIADDNCALYGDVPRIELFGRKEIEGWDCLGNDIDGKDIRDSLKELINKEDK